MSNCERCKNICVIIFWIVSIVGIVKFYHFIFKPEDGIYLDVDTWLEQNSLSKYKQLFKNKGISQLSQCGQVDNLPELPAPDEQRLQKAAVLLQQRLVLRQWLVKHNLQLHYPRLLALGVTSLEDVYWLEDSKVRQVLNKDFTQWSTARQSLPINKFHLESLKADLWSEVVKLSNHQDAWTWGGMLVVSVSVAGLVTLAAMTQPSLAPEAKHSLLQYVTGKYLMPSNCKVVFHWPDPHPVGHTVCFMVHFHQRNGQPYPICDTDQLSVDVSEGSRKMAIITELGSPTDPNCANVARVKFMVRHAGPYVITVMIGSQHVAGSPFTKTFTAGSVDAQRTAVLRYCSTVVCTANIGHVIYVEPRDEYNNVCSFAPNSNPTKGFTVDINQLGGKDQESQLSNMEDQYSIAVDYDWNNSRINFQFKFIYESCYHATIRFCDVELHNGDFDIIVLNSIDSTLVHKNVALKNHNVCYEAKLLGINGERMIKPKKVVCYVSPKQLIIKEMILKFIPKRLYTFRLCPSTKFHFEPDFLTKEGISKVDYSFLIDDGCQPKIELSSRERNVIAATFTHFLLKNMGGSETFRDKQDFFYHEVRKFHHKHYHDKISVKVQRSKLLESSIKATKNFSVTDWCRCFEVIFQGEQAVDWGGVRREWFELICAQLFDSRYGLFNSFYEGQQSLVHPSPQRPAHLKLRHFEFAGRIVGKCLYESALGGSYRQMVRARFTRSFLAQVIGLRVHYKYFEQDDPDLYLTKIKYLLDNDIDEIDTELHFIEEEYDNGGQLIKTVELVPNGAKIRVTNATKHRYLDALAQFRLATSVHDEVEAFLKGLNELIPDNLLSIFDENELELLLCGTGHYSITDFKANHSISGNSVEFQRIIGWFWAAVSNFTQEEMARLLQFTTGCSQLPAGGFKELNPKFQIIPAPTFGNLPTAHTWTADCRPPCYTREDFQCCMDYILNLRFHLPILFSFNQLCLPDYDSYEQFEKCLLIAISEGTEGFGMV